MVVDTENWDKAMATNTPGQSGNPTSVFYNNLIESWARDEFFPIYYPKEKIIEVAAEQRLFVPKNQ